MDQELRILRNRQRAGQERFDAARGVALPFGSAAVLAMTTTVNSYPMTASAFYAMLPQDLDGGETEGGSASYTAESSRPFYAWNAGTAVPPSGTPVVCHAVGGRWCFRFDG